MEASGFPTPKHDDEEERDVRSDFETLKKLYGLLDNTVGTNTESNNEEILDHKSRIFLMKLLDGATQHTLRRHIKMLPGPSLTPQLANALSIKRAGQSTNEDLEQNHNICLRHSAQRGDPNLLKSQFSIKSRQNQAQGAPNQVSSSPYHPMSRYQGRSGLDRSSRPLIGGIPTHRCEKERLLYCPSEHQPNSNAPKMAGLTPKRILASPMDRTNSTLRPVRLDRISSPPEHSNLQVVPYKIGNQNLETEEDSFSDVITSTRELNSRMLDQRKTDKFNKRTLLHERLPVLDRKMKPRDNLPVVSSSQSNSDTSSESSKNSPSSSKQILPMVIQKPGHSLGATHSKKLLIPQHDHKKPLQRITSMNSSSSSKRKLPMVIRKPGHPFGATHSERQIISQHDHNKPLQRIKDSRRELVSSPRILKKPAKEIDMPEQKRGRFRRLKDKLAVVLHHRHGHHHHHHHHSKEDESSKARDNENPHHRSLWKYLKDIGHHSSERPAEIVPSQHHNHRRTRALFHKLFGHLRGNGRRKKARLGRTVSRVRVRKLHWWQKFRRHGPKKLTYGKKARHRLTGAKGKRKKKLRQ